MVVAERRYREAHVAALAAGQRVVHLIAFVMRIMVSSCGRLILCTDGVPSVGHVCGRPLQRRHVRREECGIVGARCSRRGGRMTQHSGQLRHSIHDGCARRQVRWKTSPRRVECAKQKGVPSRLFLHYVRHRPPNTIK